MRQKAETKPNGLNLNPIMVWQKIAKVTINKV
jgi:hypothetical protein